MKRKSKTQQIPVLHIYHSQDAELYRANIREDKVYLKNGKVAQFTNRGVFTIKVKLRKRKYKIKCLVYLDGKAECAKIKDDAKLKELIKEYEANPEKFQVIPEPQESIFEPLTDKDRVTVVIREIAKQLGKFKPIETWQFVVIIALLAANIVIQFIW